MGQDKILVTACKKNVNLGESNLLSGTDYL